MTLGELVEGSVHDVAAGILGWTLLVDPWEAVRALGSRRTVEELRALPAEGDCEPYLKILDEHLPLPTRSLGEG